MKATQSVGGRSGYPLPRRPLKSSGMKQLYPTWQTCTAAGKIPVSHSPFPTAVVPTWLCFPSIPTPTLSGDALIFCLIEKTEIIKHKRSSFSTCNPHPSLPPDLKSYRELEHTCYPLPLPPSGPYSSL